jgi:miniconductance mechanosensitive channel
MAELQALLDQYPFLQTLIGLLAVALLAYLADRVARRIFLASVDRVARGTSFRFDDLLIEYKVFSRLAHFAPAIAVYFGIRLVPDVPEGVEAQIQHAATAVMILVGVSALGNFLTAVSRAYATSEIARGRPIEAYVQVTKIAMYLIGAIFFIATLMDRNPWGLLTGLGALMAVLLLVFRDTILSFVASLQMASYDMVRVGDWIEMSQFGADGDVVELSLHTVKVQNWDKTITAIPTHKLIENSFKNWRGMQDSGGRRIKRSFFVDMSTIRFLTAEEIDRLENFAALRDYVRKKRKELEDYNRQYADDPGLVVNARRLTNVGTLRAYLVGYLRKHPKIHQGMTMIVRQLEPTPQGLPIELYVFTNVTGWNEYEGIQSDIFDHVFSIVPEFGLRVFQAPSGFDFHQIGKASDD